MAQNLKAELQAGIAELGLQIPTDAQEKMLAYLALLQKWNKVYNLTAIADPAEGLRMHVLDSLAVLPHLWAGEWLDVGSGGGIPGLILASSQPEWAFTLMDSNSKKTSFIQQAAIELGLKNVRVYCGRVEAWHPEHKFDGIISRAFTELQNFVAVTQHLLKPEGRWAAMKGQPEPELARLQGAEVEQVIPLHVPGLDAARSLVVMRAN
jgi:16S rRNA (guanine527-N7)-methyltransferase